MPALKDLSGERFGRLLVLCRAPNRKKSTMWHCLCDCGSNVDVASTSLLGEHTKSCGCWGKESKGQWAKKDMIGKKFGRLTVLEELPDRAYNRIMYKCLCDCGSTSVVAGQDLRQGKTKSCGCLGHKNKDVPHPRHGLTKHPLFHIWGGILQRCYTRTAKNYPNYGARGISVCDLWRYDFLSFYNWSMSNGWKQGLTLDRINPNGDYSPGNCRWVTQSVQNRNKRNSLPKFEWNGESKYLQEWAAEYGINYSTVFSRVKRGWDLEKALITPPLQ